MMKRLFVISLMVLTLPVLASMVGESRVASQFNPVAVAGHVKVGGQPTGEYCTPCGCPKHPECVCDPGEAAGPCDEPVIAESGGNASAGALLALFAVGVTIRMVRRK